jgi:hypothetical protein
MALMSTLMPDERWLPHPNQKAEHGDSGEHVLLHSISGISEWLLQCGPLSFLPVLRRVLVGNPDNRNKLNAALFSPWI